MNFTTKHGHAVGGRTSSTYRSWSSMFPRCTNPKNRYYHNYGGAGISICPEWNDFTVFLADMGIKPSDDHSLDRIDNSLGYFKGNCRWATRLEQNRNKRSCIFVEIAGEKLRLMEAYERYTPKNIPLNTVYRRIHFGWPPVSAVLSPLRTKNRADLMALEALMPRSDGGAS